jgi:hypothetical protein
MKTAPNVQLRAVDFSCSEQLVNQAAMPTRILPHSSQTNQLRSASAAKNMATGCLSHEKGLEVLNRVAHSRLPLMGTNEYPRTRILKGKVGSSCLN